MRLTDDISLVGGGNTGFNLSAPLDCHIYLINGGNGELALVDAGMGGKYGETERIIEHIERDGYDRNRITTLILTHYHADHAGGTWDWAERLPELRVIGSPLTAKVMQDGDESAISLPEARAGGMYPQDYVLNAWDCAPDLVDSRPFPFGKLTITPFDTPGHCAGHVSLLVEGGALRYFIGGDLIFYGGTIVAQNIHDCSIQDYSASVARMTREVEFDSLLPGHYTISMRDGMRHLDKAHQIFSQLGMPRNAP
jgi:glyoxylase-like metal-dependent hydrolase (beta-lactamase superfamily II)